MSEHEIDRMLEQMADTAFERNTVTTRVLCGQSVKARPTRNNRILFSVDDIDITRVGLAAFLIANQI